MSSSWLEPQEHPSFRAEPVLRKHGLIAPPVVLFQSTIAPAKERMRVRNELLKEEALRDPHLQTPEPKPLLS